VELAESVTVLAFASFCIDEAFYVLFIHRFTV
jgi:hypothetical protein